MARSRVLSPPNPLLADHHYSTIAFNTFLVDVPAGDYVVNLTLDPILLSPMRVSAEGAPPLSFQPTRGSDHYGFPVHVEDGQLDLVVSGDYGWHIDALDLYPVPIASHLITGDGKTITGSGATPDALVTVVCEGGIVLSEDVNPHYAGVQVRADASGAFQFQVQPPGVTGIVSITSEEVDGGRVGLLEDYNIPLSPLHIDFDTDAPDATVPGYIGLLPHEVYTTSRGYGWQSPVMARSRVLSPPNPLLADHHYSTIAFNTFLVDVPAGDYVVNLTLDPILLSPMRVSAEGCAATELSTDQGQRSLWFPGARGGWPIGLGGVGRLRLAHRCPRSLSRPDSLSSNHR